MNNEDYKLNFARNLKKYMTLHEKKQQDLMDDLGLSSSTISNWCTGLKFPRMDKIEMLADYFHVSVSALMEPGLNTPAAIDDTNIQTVSEPNDSSLDTLSNNLRYYLSTVNMTQKDLSEFLGVSCSSVYNWCNGVKAPRMYQIDKMCDLFRCTQADLFAKTLPANANQSQGTIFSQNLNRLMKLHGKTQTDLINDLYLNKSTVSSWCNGSRLPRMNKLDMLAKYFNVDSSELLDNKKSSSAAPRSENLEAQKVAQEICSNKDLFLLFEAARDADPEDLQTVHTVLMALKRKSNT